MRKIFITICVLSLSLGGLFPVLAQAQEKLTLTITPPLIKNNVSPGQVWQSSVKMVNNNAEVMDIYVQVVDFIGGDEEGTVKFIPIEEQTEESRPFLLSQWINIESGPITVPPFGSQVIPFVIEVPEDSDPGGHYAAILAGTNPVNSEIEGTMIKVSSLLASLVLITVGGEVTEEGRIREFITESKINTTPDVNFKVRFENQGNVHIQPQGEIRLFNMFNKDNGVININHQTEFGNVLPGGIRSWDFTWQGEGSLFEMGRYRADLVLGFGDRSRQTVNQSTFFWVIYVWPLAITVGSIILLFFVVFFSIRGYIRRAVKITQRQAGIITETSPRVVKKKVSVSGDENVVDLKASVKSAVNTGTETSRRSGWRTIKRFALVVIIVILIIGGVIIYASFKDGINSWVTTTDNNQTASEESSSNLKKISQEMMNKDDLPAQTGDSELSTENSSTPLGAGTDEESAMAAGEEMGEDEQAGSTDEAQEEEVSAISYPIGIVILNGSGTAGLATRVAELLNEDKYEIVSIGNADNYDYEKTIIRHQSGYEEEAEGVATMLSLDAVLEEAEQEEEIVIIIGQDF